MINIVEILLSWFIYGEIVDENEECENDNIDNTENDYTTTEENGGNKEKED